MPRKYQPLQHRTFPWVVLHIICKLYLAGVAISNGGFQFADLVRFIAQLNKPDARTLSGLLSKHKLELPAFYLTALLSEFGIQLPDPPHQLVSRARRVRRASAALAASTQALVEHVVQPALT